MAANLGVGVGDRVSIGRSGMPDAACASTASSTSPRPSSCSCPRGRHARHAGAGARQRPDRPGGALAGAVRRARARAPRARSADQVHANLAHGALPPRPLGRLRAGARARQEPGDAHGRGRPSSATTSRPHSMPPVATASTPAWRSSSSDCPGALLAMLSDRGDRGRGRRSAAAATRRSCAHAGPRSAVLTRLALAESLLVGIAGGAVGLGAGDGDRGTPRSARRASARVAAQARPGPASRCSPPWSSRRSRSPCPRGVTLAGSPWPGRACAVPQDGRSLVGGYGLDLLAIAGAVLVYRATSGGGAQLVLVAEGSTQVSVNYWSFLAPHAGVDRRRAALLPARRARLEARPALIARGVAAALGPARRDGGLEHVQQRSSIARALALIALTTCFAATTAAFNATYQQQAEADARLSNGADVVLAATGASGLPASLRDSVANVPGVVVERAAAASLRLHRPRPPGSLRRRCAHRRAWRETPGLVVRGGTAVRAARTLARTPNGVLLSEEVVHDYQLHPGDRITMRAARPAHPPGASRPLHLRRASRRSSRPRRRMPTPSSMRAMSPEATHDPGVSTLLLQTSGSPAGRRAARARRWPGRRRRSATSTRTAR